ncbi:MAG: hypothetical protein L0229_29690 [Blastocatellia bacterium]|nr:hypothetical protein [Blastocatellia bacterium]
MTPFESKLAEVLAKELINYGALGAVVLWFMWRMEPRLKEMAEARSRSAQATTHAINRQSELLLLVIADQTEDGRRGRASAIEELLARLGKEIARDLEEEERSRSYGRATSHGRKGV